MGMEVVDWGWGEREFWGMGESAKNLTYSGDHLCILKDNEVT